MLPIAFGTQTGGSVIRPAAFCGVAGFKPSYKLIPTVGVKCFSWHLDTVGLFAAGVADVAFAAAAITERDLRVDRRAPSPPRVGFCAQPPLAGRERRHAAAVESAAAPRRRAGARVDDVAAGRSSRRRGGRIRSSRTTRPTARSPSNTTATATASRR